MKTPRVSNHDVEQLDATPPARLTLHVYTIERNGLSPVIAVTGKRHNIKALQLGGVLIERANGDRIFLPEGSVSRVDHKTREITLDAIN